MKDADGKWYKLLCWQGKVEKAECTHHFYGYSGKMPCTGEKRCLLCGKPEEVRVNA